MSSTASIICLRHLARCVYVVRYGSGGAYIAVCLGGILKKHTEQRVMTLSMRERATMFGLIFVISAGSLGHISSGPRRGRGLMDYLGGDLFEWSGFVKVIT